MQYHLTCMKYKRLILTLNLLFWAANAFYIALNHLLASTLLQERVCNEKDSFNIRNYQKVIVTIIRYGSVNSRVICIGGPSWLDCISLLALTKMIVDLNFPSNGLRCSVSNSTPGLNFASEVFNVVVCRKTYSSLPTSMSSTIGSCNNRNLRLKKLTPVNWGKVC